MPPELEAALMQEMQPPLPPPDGGVPPQYEVQPQADGTLVILENMPDGEQVARKIVPMGKSAAPANV